MFFRLTFAAAAALLVTVAASSARADLKLVQKITESGLLTTSLNADNNARLKAVTTYHKGNKVRCERNNVVLLYDGATRKLLALDPAKKTYQQIKAGMPSEMRFKTTATVIPGGQTRRIGGKSAKNYVVKSTLVEQPSANANPESGGPFLTMRVENEIWKTEAVKGVSLQQGYSFEMDVLNALGSGEFGLKPMTDKMAMIKGVTLASTQKVSFSRSATASAAATPMGSSITKIELVSLSESALPDSLFILPKDYTQAKTP